jgi:hypothetical protein
MAFSSLAGRLDRLPLVLAGPVLRQVTESSITVWVALKRSFTAFLTVFDDKQRRVMDGFADTTAIGKSLHVVAVTARLLSPSDKLVENIVYQYKLDFGADNVIAFTLKSATNSARLAYPPFDNPTFCLPPKDLNKLRLVHGSCRKPHGEGRDALAVLDSLIAAKAPRPLERPHQLILSGDQIYADDVADVLLRLLNDAGKVLLGWHEVLDTTPVASPLPIENWPSYYRQVVLTEAEFTSDDLKSHLATLGEFLSMYLFAWSDVLWPAALPDFDDVLSWVTSFVGPKKDQVTKYITDRKNTVVQERSDVDVFRSTLASVRCALANIPTYMICDDHEVTDDWNITLRFCLQVYRTPVGMRVVQNGLVAFAICQAWGNAPERFGAGSAGAALLARLADVSAGRASYDAVSPQLQQLVGVHQGSTVLANKGVFHDGEDSLPPNGVNSQSLRFNFRIEGKGHVIVVTDTRTWRSFSSVDGHAVFLATSVRPEMARQLDLPVPPPQHDDRLLLVVLTTNAPPIASFRFAASRPALVDLGGHPGENIRGLMKDLALSDAEGVLERNADQQRRAVFAYDLYDSWELPSAAFESLIAKLDSLLQARGAQQVILLSGDVHSSFASRLTVFAKSSGSLVPRMVVAQLISSPFKNQTVKTRGQQLEGYTYAPGWIARKLVPAFVPESFDGPTLAGSVSSRYRLDYLVAVPAGSPAPPDPLVITEGDDVANLRNYSSVASYGNKLVYSGASPLQIIGHNNIAELTFVWGADKRARHTLHWVGPGGKTFETVYDVSLNPADSKFGSLP